MNGRDQAFASLAGVLAHGYDFGRPEEPQSSRRGREMAPEQERFLIDSGSWTREECEAEKTAVARGELEEAEQQTLEEMLVATLAAAEAADWLGIRETQLHALLAAGEVVAFVSDGELRYPAWQFTEDPAQPVLPGMARLTPAWGDEKHPATILGFMYNACLEIPGTDDTFTPIEWLTLGGDVQVVLDHLEAASWR